MNPSLRVSRVRSRSCFVWHTTRNASVGSTTPKRVATAPISPATTITESGCSGGSTCAWAMVPFGSLSARIPRSSPGSVIVPSRAAVVAPPPPVPPLPPPPPPPPPPPQAVRSPATRSPEIRRRETTRARSAGERGRPRTMIGMRGEVLPRTARLESKRPKGARGCAARASTTKGRVPAPRRGTRQGRGAGPAACTSRILRGLERRRGDAPLLRLRGGGRGGGSGGRSGLRADGRPLGRDAGEQVGRGRVAE